MKMISDAAYAIVVFMTAATTIFAPITLRVLYRKQEQTDKAPAYDTGETVERV
jgi:Kef-type K+ transport system membrane component KefB